MRASPSLCDVISLCTLAHTIKDRQERMMMSFFLLRREEEERVTSYSGRGESRISRVYYK